MAWSNIALVTFVNGLANPLIFIALSTMSFATLRREQMGGATGIYNLMRNLGGSIGISMATTLLARRAQVHQNVMVAKMTPYDPVFQQRLEALRKVLTPKVGASQAGQQALGILYKTLVAQATLLAFVDNFRLITVLALCCIPLAILLKRARARPAAAARTEDSPYPSPEGRGLFGGLAASEANLEKVDSALSDCTPSRRSVPITQVGKTFTPAFSQRSGRPLTASAAHST